MDLGVIEALRAAGLHPERVEELRVPTLMGEQGRVVPLEQDLPVPVMKDGGTVTWVHLQPISKLWMGSVLPPSFMPEPPPKYEAFFLLLECTAAGYCCAVGKPERDQEFERLYQRLGQEPDSEDSNPLFSYLRAAARLYLSVRDVSRVEFKAVAERLRSSVKAFSSRMDSTNYHRLVLEEFFVAPGDHP